MGIQGRLTVLHLNLLLHSPDFLLQFLILGFLLRHHALLFFQIFLFEPTVFQLFLKSSDHLLKFGDPSAIPELPVIFHPIFQRNTCFFIILHISGLFFHTGQPGVHAVVDCHGKILLREIAAPFKRRPVQTKQLLTQTFRIITAWKTCNQVIQAECILSLFHSKKAFRPIASFPCGKLHTAAKSPSLPGQIFLSFIFFEGTPCGRFQPVKHSF